FELYRQQSRLGEDPGEEQASGEVPVDREMVNAEERSEVRQVLSEMPEKDRIILRWVFFEERDKDEVCRTLGVDREYLRVLLHRAKTRFRTGWTKRLATKAARSTPIG